eukprot:213551-Prorocentrum_minimum.AAC.1
MWDTHLKSLKEHTTRLRFFIFCVKLDLYELFPFLKELELQNRDFCSAAASPRWVGVCENSLSEVL